jgi:dienelactone hydrolase
MANALNTFPKFRTVLLAIAVLGAAAGAQPHAALPATASQFDQWRRAIRQSLFIDDPLPPLEPKSYGKFFPADGVVAERVTYGTSYGMRVPAIVYRPSKNDHKSETNVHDTFVPGQQMPARMGGQFVTDIMQAVSYLSSRADVDPKRIAVAAYSMGSLHAAIAGAIDTRIHALVLSGGGNLDGPGDYWARSSKVMCQSGPSKALDFLPDRGAVLYALNQRRGPTFIMNGTEDPVIVSVQTKEPFFARLRDRTVAITGTSAGLFETYWIEGAGHRPNFVTRPAALWLQRQLHFPNWTEAEIRSMDEVHVSEWSAKTGAHIGGKFQTELSEGGVRAISTNVPNVPWEELQAVPIDDWQRHKDDFIWEEWVIRARAASQ